MYLSEGSGFSFYSPQHPIYLPSSLTQCPFVPWQSLSLSGSHGFHLLWPQWLSKGPEDASFFIVEGEIIEKPHLYRSHRGNISLYNYVIGISSFWLFCSVITISNQVDSAQNRGCVSDCFRHQFTIIFTKKTDCCLCHALEGPLIISRSQRKRDSKCLPSVIKEHRHSK